MPSISNRAADDAAAGADDPGTDREGAATSRITSPTVMRPPSPVPRTDAESSEWSAKSQRTAGLNGRAAALPEATGACGPAPVASGAGEWPGIAPRRPSPAAVAPPAAASPMRPRISPGATSSCSCFRISVSTPAPGEATSTVTLSVSSSMSGSCSDTASPTAFSQRSTCDRVPSSCPEGALISTLWTPADMSDTRDLLDGARDGLHAWNGRLEQKRTVRTRNVRHGEPLDRRIQAEERFLRDGSRDLGTKARGQIVLVHDETSMRLAHRLEHRLLV